MDSLRERGMERKRGPVRGFNSISNIFKMSAGYMRLCYIFHYTFRYLWHQNHWEAGRWGVNQRWPGPMRACLRWESANLWCIQSAGLGIQLQQHRLLGAGSGKSDIQVSVGKWCSYTPGFHSSRTGCAGERQWKTEKFEGKRVEGKHVMSGGLLQMEHSNSQRP